jgi:hypothetical protein
LHESVDRLMPVTLSARSGVTLEAIYHRFEAQGFARKSCELRSRAVIVKDNEKDNGRERTRVAARAPDPKHALLQPLSKPDRGLEPLTYRLQGDSADRLSTSVLPASKGVSEWVQIGNCGSFRLSPAGLRPMERPVGLNDCRRSGRTRSSGRDGKQA